MRRVLALLLLSVLLTAGDEPQAPVRPPSLGTQLAENGRVLATLDDWRAIMFVLVAVIVILIAFIIWDRISTSKRQDRFASAMDRMADACDALTIEIRVMSRLVKRDE